MCAQKPPLRPAPGLFLVATPIGNLEDITLRALETLRSVDLILAEDTRHTRKLLRRYEIRGALKSLHEHNETAQVPSLVGRMAAGDRIALVSDAGTPLVSDPGYELVRESVAAGVVVTPIPGPSAVLAALAGSGLPVDRFTFVGFPPRKAGARRAFFDELAEVPGTLVFLESPRRLVASLCAASESLGERQVAVARELTKVHEEFIRGTLPEVAARLGKRDIRGEVTVCVAGAPGPAASVVDDSLDRNELARRFAELRENGTPRNEALKVLARRQGVSRRAMYRILLVEEEESR